MDQPGTVGNPARGPLNRENESISLSPFARENLETGSVVMLRVSLLILHIQAKSGAYSRDSFRFPRRRPFIYSKPPYAIGSVPSLSGHAIAYRWRSVPRIHRHRASSPEGSSSCCLGRSHHAPLFPYTHYSYEVVIAC